ncbi:MAG TPA: DUF4230 domain-containing protein [Gemmatimonadales bacterium]|nr:DUF4230 domain-containing protein [Gemmatimonadales bacterium]
MTANLPPVPSSTPPAVRAPRARFVLRATLVALGALLLWALFVVTRTVRSASHLLPPAHSTVTQSVVVERTRAVARLVTSETSVRDVLTYQNRWLGSTKRALVVVTGNVLAGIDLEQEPEVRIDSAARRIQVTLPRAKVLGVEVTSLKTYDERNGLWNPILPADRDTMFQLARAQLVRSAGELAVLAHAERSAQETLRTLLGADGYEVEVTFVGPAPAGAAPVGPTER